MLPITWTQRTRESPYRGVAAVTLPRQWQGSIHPAGGVTVAECQNQWLTCIHDTRRPETRTPGRAALRGNVGLNVSNPTVRANSL